MRLPDSLECVNTLSVFLPDLHNFSEGPFADDLEEVESLDG